MSASVPEPILSIDEVHRFLDVEFPLANRFATLETLGPGTARLRHEPDAESLRPGGTVSGPVLMTLADTAAYMLILAHVGPVGLAVTTHLGIDFLRRPPPAPLHAEAELLKLGSRLAVVSVTLRPAADGPPVAFASVTYSLPPR